MLLAVVLSPGAVAAQEGEVSFPFTTSGEWEGLLDFSGYFTIDSVSDDGSFTVSVTDVIGATTITLDFRVDEEGRVDGTMPVNLEWFVEAAGAASNGDPFHVLHDHRQTGTLALSGAAARLVATGTLIHETNTVASGEQIEEVSGSESRDVEWVFSATNADCLRVTGKLTEASGISLMGSALLPPVVETDHGSTYYNELVAELLVWPKTEATPEAVKAALEEVTALADELRAREFPEASHVLALVDAWTDLKAEVEALNECEAAQVLWAPLFDKAWLVQILQSALETALEHPDHYEASELVDLWDVGQHYNALDGELVVAFLHAFEAKLDEAIEYGDMKTISDILAFATANGYTELQAKAGTASGGGT